MSQMRKAKKANSTHLSSRSSHFQFFKSFLNKRRALDSRKLGVEAVQGEQFVMGAALDDFAVAQDEDLVGFADGAEPMRDDKARAVGHQAFERFLDELFSGGV